MESPNRNALAPLLLQSIFRRLPFWLLLQILAHMKVDDGHYYEGGFAHASYIVQYLPMNHLL